MIGGMEHIILFESKITGYTGESLIIGRYRDRCLSPYPRCHDELLYLLGYKKAHLIELHQFHRGH